MIYRHTEEEITIYENDIDHINQSALKVILNDGIEKFVEEQDSLLRQDDLYYEEKAHFIVGKGVDCKIAHGNEIFKNKYHFSDLKKKPSDVVKSICNMVFDRIQEYTAIKDILPFVHYKEEIYNAANEHKYSMNRSAPTEKQMKDPELAGVVDWWNYDNRWSSMKNTQEYWDDLIVADGKQILTEVENAKIEGVYHSLVHHKHTAHLFKDAKDIDIVFQMPIYWTYEGTKCKGLIDHIIINHTAKKIMPIDEKTLGDYILRFGNAVKKRRYDIQGAFYYYGLKKNLQQLSTLLGKDVTSYHVSNFAFVAESTIRFGTPLVFPMDEELMNIGAFGDGRYMKGWMQAVQTYKEWKDINFSIEEKYKSTNGIVWLDNNFEIN